jgi:hypothetical protein
MTIEELQKLSDLELENLKRMISAVIISRKVNAEIVEDKPERLRHQGEDYLRGTIIKGDSISGDIVVGREGSEMLVNHDIPSVLFLNKKQEPLDWADATDYLFIKIDAYE